MSNRWLAEPRHLPRQCLLTGSSDPTHGPFFESERTIENFVTGRHDQVYISRVALETILNGADSPYSPIKADEFKALRDEMAEMEKTIARLEADVEKYESGDPSASLDVDKLADMLAQRITPKAETTTAKPSVRKPAKKRTTKKAS